MIISPETWYNYLNFKTNGASVDSTGPALTKQRGIISMPATTDSTSKRCSKCKQFFPATTEYFPVRNDARDGLRNDCKTCNCARASTWQKANPDKKNANNAAWQKANPDKRRASTAAWNKANRDKGRASKHRRLAHERALPYQWTALDEQRAMVYFGGLCAYCGKQADSLFATNHLDHFIPLSDTANCPGTVPSNMLPTCQHCNDSKGSKQPMEWLTRKFGKRKTAKILARITAFFKSLEVLL